MQLKEIMSVADVLRIIDAVNYCKKQASGGEQIWTSVDVDQQVSTADDLLQKLVVLNSFGRYTEA